MEPIHSDAKPATGRRPKRPETRPDEVCFPRSTIISTKVNSLVTPV